MVWCHQVRWRIARAALELGTSSTTEKGIALDRWFRDGLSLDVTSVNSSHRDLVLTDPKAYETLPVNDPLVLRIPHSSRLYLLPISPSIAPSPFILFVSQGAIPPVSPPNPFPLRVYVYLCSGFGGEPPRCRTLTPVTLKLVPNPIPGRPFPIPGEGSDESEGVVLFEATIPPSNLAEKKRWVGVHVESADGKGWLIGGRNVREVKYDASTLSLFLQFSFVVHAIHCPRTCQIFCWALYHCRCQTHVRFGRMFIYPTSCQAHSSFTALHRGDILQKFRLDAQVAYPILMGVSLRELTS